MEEVSQNDLHQAIELPDEITLRSQNKGEVITTLKTTEEQCS
jgi:hypothetical protein